MKSLLADPATKSSLPASTWLSSETLYSIGMVEKANNRHSPETVEMRAPDRPKTIIPSKGLSTYVKSTKFTPYKSVKPDLLVELNDIINSGMKRENDGGDKNLDRLQTFRTAFQRFIDESTIYQSVLATIKQEYDNAVFRLTENVRAYSLFDAKLEQEQEEHRAQLQKVSLASQSRIEQLESQLQQLTTRLLATEKDKASAETESSTLREANATMRKECDDLRTTGVTLSNSLARLEEDKRIYQAHDAECQVEIAILQGNEQKLNREIDRLQQIIQAMETLQSSMVGHEVMAAQEAVLEGMRTELKRVDTTHRQLLLRYMAIKAVADSAFKKFESAGQEGEGSSALEQARLQNTVRDLAIEHVTPKRGVSRTKSNRRVTAAPTDPADKIMHLIEKGANPRLIIEALLNQIELHHLEGKGSAHNNADQGGALLSNVLPSGTVAFDGNFNTAAEEFRSPWQHFDGLGFEAHVPTYLRFNGKLQNLFISKKELVGVVNQIWAMRITHEMHCNQQLQQQTSNPFGSTSTDNADAKPSSATPALKASTASSYTLKILAANTAPLSASLIRSLPLNPSMAVFFEHYLEDKHGNRMRAVEMAYNITDALKKFSALSDCMLFAAILEGRLCADVWNDQYLAIDKVKEELVKENAAHISNPNEWKLTPDMLMRTLRKALPVKGEHSFSKLAKALMIDNKGSRYVNVTNLLTEDECGTRSEFFEQLKLQHITECLSFERHVMDCIDQFSGSKGALPAGGDNNSEPALLSISKFREALAYSDANKIRTEINQLLARGCGLSVEETLLMEARRSAVPVEDFKRRLRAGLLKKSAPNKGGK